MVVEQTRHGVDSRVVIIDITIKQHQLSSRWLCWLQDVQMRIVTHGFLKMGTQIIQFINYMYSIL